MTTKRVLVPIADGTEELEAVALIDILRRAGAEVTVASIMSGRQITGSRGVRLVGDARISECEQTPFDLVVLPGGMPGARQLRDSEILTRILMRQAKEKRLYGAICASPVVVLAHHGLLDGKRATCHPEFIEGLPVQTHVTQTVVADGNCITSRGAGTAVPFALFLVERLFGEEKRREVALSMVLSEGF